MYSHRISALELDADQYPIAFVDSYPQASAGQQETLLSMLARCPSKSIAPEIITPSDGPLVERLRTKGYKVHVLPQPATIGTYGGAVYNYGLGRKLKMALQGVRYISQLHSFLRKQRYKAVFCNDMRGLLTLGVAARLQGIPVMIWDKLDKPHGIYDALQLPIASANLVIANGVTAKYPVWQKRLWSRKIKLVRDGIETSRFSSARRGALQQELNLPEDAIVCGIVGSVTPRKGHDLLLPAFENARQKVGKLHLAVIGETPEQDEEFASQLRSNSSQHVHWLGGRKDMDQLMASLDILISPSRHEGMGRVNVEAMAASVPVIGALGTGIAEVVVDDATGILLNPENTDELSKSIIRLAENPQLRASMGAAGKDRAETHFEADRQMEMALDELKKMAK